MANTGNTPSGNPGAGTTETSSSPDPVMTPTPSATVRATDVSGARSATGATEPIVTDGVTDADFKKDGDLRKATIDKINETAPRRGGERSFNEVTGKTTVTTTYGGQTVTFEEDGDTRNRDTMERPTDSAIRAMDNADEAEEN